MISFVVFLKFLAVVLVINSHCKGVYPTDILSFGGGFGLSLFYMISGYLLSDIKSTTRLKPWYIKKVIRLYVPLWIIKMLEVITGYLKITTAEELVRNFIYPGMWFTASIIILYLIYFFLVKYVFIYGERTIRISIYILIICYLLLFLFKPQIAVFSFSNLTFADSFSVETPYLISQFIWLICMLMGGYAGRMWETGRYNLNRFSCYCMLAVSFIAFFAIRVLGKRGFDLAEIFLLFVYCGFAAAVFSLGMQKEDMVSALLQTKLGTIIKELSKSSLEIYYIQFMMIDLLKTIFFPLNLFLIIVLAFSTGLICHVISERIIRVLTVRI